MVHKLADSQMMERLHRTLRGRNMIINVFELWVAFAGIVGGAVYLLDSNALSRNSVSVQIGFGLAMLWNAAYCVSGIAVSYGLIRPSPRIEVAGLSILGAATAVNGISIVSVFGIRGITTASTFLTLAAAAWIRAWFVFRATDELAKESDRATRD